MRYRSEPLEGHARSCRAGRKRAADEVRLIFALDGRDLQVADCDGEGIINLATDESFVLSLDRIGFYVDKRGLA